MPKNLEILEINLIDLILTICQKKLSEYFTLQLYMLDI